MGIRLPRKPRFAATRSPQSQAQFTRLTPQVTKQIAAAVKPQVSFFPKWNRQNTVAAIDATTPVSNAPLAISRHMLKPCRAERSLDARGCPTRLSSNNCIRGAEKARGESRAVDRHFRYNALLYGSAENDQNECGDTRLSTTAA